MSEHQTIINPQPPNNSKSDPAKTLTIIIYGLQAASFFIGITFLVALVINYVKRDDVRGTWLESHFRWQIRTFWFCLLWAVIGVLLSAIIIGLFILFANAIWVIYRIAKGWIDAADNKPMYINK